MPTDIQIPSGCRAHRGTEITRVEVNNTFMTSDNRLIRHLLQTPRCDVGFEDTVLLWLMTYLSGRLQFGHVGDESSPTVPSWLVRRVFFFLVQSGILSDLS